MSIAPYINFVLKGFKENSIFLCPADRTGVEEFVITNQHFGKNSYCCNLAIMDSSGDTNVDGNSLGIKLSWVVKSSETIMLAENHHDSNCIGWGDYNGKCYNKSYVFEYTVQSGTLENDSGKIGYHYAGNNWAFSDGHVKWLQYLDTIYPTNLWLLKK